jgi:hypothetical protein
MNIVSEKFLTFQMLPFLEDAGFNVYQQYLEMDIVF